MKIPLVLLAAWTCASWRRCSNNKQKECHLQSAQNFKLLSKDCSYSIKSHSYNPTELGTFKGRISRNYSTGTQWLDGQMFPSWNTSICTFICLYLLILTEYMIVDILEPTGQSPKQIWWQQLIFFPVLSMKDRGGSRKFCLVGEKNKSVRTCAHTCAHKNIGHAHLIKTTPPLLSVYSVYAHAKAHMLLTQEHMGLGMCGVKSIWALACAYTLRSRGVCGNDVTWSLSFTYLWGMHVTYCWR